MNDAENAIYMKTNRSLWPLGIIIAFVLFAIGVATAVSFACRSNNDLVSKNNYDEEIGFQTRIDSLDRTRQLATRAMAAYDRAAGRILIALPAEHAGRNLTGQIQLYRPSAAGMDQQLKLQPDSNGGQSLDVAALPQGLWRIRVSWSVGGNDYYLDQKVVIGPVNPQNDSDAAPAAAKAALTR